MGFFAGGVVLTSVPKIGSEPDRNQNLWPRFETEDAIWIPLYEIHTKRIALPELNTLKKIDGYYLEMFEDSKALQNADPNQLLSVTGSSGFSFTTTRFVPPDVIEFLKSKNTSIFFEAISLPDDISLVETIIKLVELQTAIMPSFFSVYSKYKELRKNNVCLDNNAVHKKSAYRSLITLAYIGWAISDVVAVAPLYVTELNRDSGIAPSKLQQLSYELMAKASNLHLEDFTVFFRNIISARKLRVISTILNKEKKTKPTISFQFGAGHAGLSDLMKLNPDLLFFILSLYPGAVIKKIVEHNGGIEAFSTTYHLKFNPGTNEYEKELLLDYELKEYLENRLSKPKQESINK